MCCTKGAVSSQVAQSCLKKNRRVGESSDSRSKIFVVPVMSASVKGYAVSLGFGSRDIRVPWVVCHFFSCSSLVGEFFYE